MLITDVVCAEAPVGIEPTVRDLQSPALPLGYGAAIANRSSFTTFAFGGAIYTRPPLGR